MPTALITGASRGLGHALADALAARGWRLLLDARGVEDLRASVRHLGAAAVSVPGDVTDRDHRAALAAAAVAAGGLDLVVHNASTLGASPRPDLDEVDGDVLRRTFETNVVAPVLLNQALRPALRPGATVVAITSDAAVEPYAGWGPYGASKAALEQAFAIYGAERPDLRVLVVDPGDLRTRLHQEAFPGEDLSELPPPEQVVPALLGLFVGDHPTGRYRAAEVATTSAPAVTSGSAPAGAAS